MNILWLTNIEPHIVSRYLNKKENVYGGWLDDISNKLINNYHITFVYKSNKIKIGESNNFSYYSFKENNDNSKYFELVLNKKNYDIIHIWGTEFKHSLVMFNVCSKLNLENKVIVSTQGLVSEISKVYFSNLPKNIINYKTFNEMFRNKNIMAEYEDYNNRGKYEIELLKRIKFAIYRTDWDKKIIKKYNNNANVFRLKDSLREVFYSNEKWSYDNCKKYSIFVSQSNYSIKGFHLLLEAVNIIKNKYPNIIIYTTGYNVFTIPFFKVRTYQLYIKQLIEKYNLKDNVVFLGFLNQIQMKQMYLKSNIFISPSIIENESNSMCEAMITGTPIIASDVGGISTILRDRIDGYLYQVNDINKLSELIDFYFSNTKIYNSLSNNSIERSIELFDRDKNYNDLINIYNEIIKMK